MHDVFSNRFASVVPACSNRFAPTQSEPLGVLWTRAPTRLPRSRLVTLRDAGERRRARWNLPGERRTGKYNAFVWANTGTSTDQGDSLSIAGYRGNRSCVEGIFLNLTVEKRCSVARRTKRYSDHVPPGPNTWTLNIQPLGQFRPHRSFLLARFTLPSSVARLLHTAA